MKFWQQSNTVCQTKQQNLSFDGDWPDRRLVLWLESASSISHTTQRSIFAHPEHLHITVLSKNPHTWKAKDGGRNTLEVENFLYSF